MLKLVMTPPQNELHQQWARRLEQTLPQYRVAMPQTDEEARQELADADAAYGWVSPQALATARKLRWLQNPQAGPAPGYYYPELIVHPVVICNPRGIYFDHISHHILMFILALSRGLPYYVDAQKQRRWDQEARQSPYIDLADATALIVGVGGIGHETARLCLAFGMTVLGIDPRPEYEIPGAEVHPTADLDALLPRADFVISTTPHTPETEGMWRAEQFRLMKPTAYFINVGRGKTTVLDDLVAAIEGGVIAGCGLDVFEIEPLPSTHRLWTLPNVLLTPHVAIRDAENITERRYELLIDNARRFAADEPLRNIVNKAAWY
jgi:phosphoglycerate dehydrogenase-like enzyme